MRKNEIKESALSIFAHKGYADCTMQDIAEANAMNKASLYFYFKSKSELYAEVLNELVDSYFQDVQDTAARYAESPIETLMFEVFQTFIRHCTLEELLLFKKSLLMGLSDVDTEVREIAKSANRNLDLRMRGLLIPLISPKTSQPEDRVAERLNSFQLFIFSFLDWTIINTSYALGLDVEIESKKAWQIYWNGSRID